MRLGPLDSTGNRPIIIKALVALPNTASSSTAEAWGSKLAALIAGALPTTSVRIAGDNLPIVRFCNGTGRLRNPTDALIIEGPLSRLSLLGKATEWFAVRRRFNKAADALATEAVNTARLLHDANALAPALYIQLNTPAIHFPF